MALIEVKDLTKTYIEGDTITRVLKQGSFEVKKGEFVLRAFFGIKSFTC